MNVSPPLSLLIVDDEPDMLCGLARILKLRGFEVATVGSGQAAVEYVRQREPHGILMDVCMPGINGVDAFRQIRAIAPNVFVILMTGFTNLMDEARDEGPTKVLSKPLDLDDVCTLIEHTAVTRPILVVDDEPDFLRSLTRALVAREFDVHRAADLEQAISIFEKRPRAMVLLDMKLSGTSGLDVLRQIKQRNPSALVMLMSGHSEMHPDMEQGLTMSASEYITKPFDIDNLIGTLRRLMCEPKKSAEL
ncbi:MAG: response regulator [Planctomycetota bacterium]|nr:response regulator [Planctomycetota bacterium]